MIRKRRRLIFHIILFIILVFFSILMLVPLIWMISTSFKLQKDIYKMPPVWIPNPSTLSHYIAVLEQVPFFRFLFNSMLTSCIISLSVILTSSLAAYAFTRIDFRYKNKIFLAFLATMMIPSYVLMIPFFMIINEMHLVNTYAGLILPGLVSVFGIYMLRQFFLSIPKEYDESAFIDGCSRLRTLLSIIMPMSKPAISALIIFSFMSSWNNFLWPLIVITNTSYYTLPLGITYFQQVDVIDWGGTMAMAFLTTIPVLIVYLLAQRYFIEGMTMAGIKG